MTMPASKFGCVVCTVHCTVSLSIHLSLVNKFMCHYMSFIMRRHGLEADTRDTGTSALEHCSKKMERKRKTTVMSEKSVLEVIFK